MPEAPYCLVPLRARDGSVRAWTIVDTGDLDWANQYRWYLHKKGYAGRGQYLGGGAKARRVRQFRMAREIVGLEHGDPRVADHINGMRLDNRRENLRIITAAQNAQNIRRPVGRSGYRGVKRNTSGRWMAVVRGEYLGTFRTPEEAYIVALAYRRAHMPFAMT